MAIDFRLKRIMKIAESEKAALESKYQELFQALEQLAGNLIDLMNKKKTVQIELNQQLSQSMTIDSMKLHLFDVEKYEKIINLRTSEYDQAKRRLEELQPILLEKTIEVKKYEKIRDRQRSVIKTEQKKKEMKEMDEIASLRVVKNG
ncbi:MAG: flagellar export protein FliJ [Sporolactobacillus sp.]